MKAEWISAWDWWGMLWDAGQACGTDEGKQGVTEELKAENQMMWVGEDG